ncbi:methyltransferase [Mycobacterium sp. MS1601]|uniref:class I SAM-dependent methyltransferase n=1 Tax=Mycobacterium sp. MS1601 TaxID=1936029 RepID=UPI0009795D82|nr:class I SAM-dependent methyltransferase [Mycobacterium sp. MS1601]AQA04039.1 methyltransferase [Mycobacterium sp. MS1601]
MDETTRHKAELTGVSETALLTLAVRAGEARRPDALIDDPVAVRLVDAIDFDFAKFGQTNRQDMAIRAKAFDQATLDYLNSHPGATVVALAEGLQTSFWRLDAALPDARFRWLTVDFPPVVEIRERLLPTSPRITTLAQSALDFSWMDAVDPSEGVFITAEGLLMYLQPDEALGLITECARRFPGGRMAFDLAPPWFAGLASKGRLRPSRRYAMPAMPFARTVGQLAELQSSIPGITAVHDMPTPKGRGLVMNAVITTIFNNRAFDRIRPSFTLLEFG